jgi:hypothetical protein
MPVNHPEPFIGAVNSFASLDLEKLSVSPDGRKTGIGVDFNLQKDDYNTQSQWMDSCPIQHDLISLLSAPFA